MVMIEIEEVIKRLLESFDDVIDDSSDEKLVDCCVRCFDEVKNEMKNQPCVEDRMLIVFCIKSWSSRFTSHLVMLIIS